VIINSICLQSPYNAGPRYDVPSIVCTPLSEALSKPASIDRYKYVDLA